MIVEPVSWDHPDAVMLREAQSAEIGKLYAAEPSVTHRSGSEIIEPDSIVGTFLAYGDGKPIGHIALRLLDGKLEIKRMYVLPSHRGSGVANDLLAAVESSARERGVRRLVLHTGDQQHAAIGFYVRHGYLPIPVYPPYQSVAYSLCFEKVL